MTRLLSVVSTQQEIELSTEFVFPPIPSRSMDWSAIDANTYAEVLPSTDDATGWFAARYQDWQHAFELGAQDGFVVLH
jgi:hypothetical protein